MGTTSTPTCLHCGYRIDRPDKPFCSKCGQYWNVRARTTSQFLPTPMRHLQEESANSLPTSPPGPLRQLNDELLRMSTQMQPHVQIATSGTNNPGGTSDSHFQTNKPPTSEELREKLRMLQEKMQPHRELQEKTGSLYTIPEDKSTSLSQTPALVLQAALTRDELLDTLRELRTRISGDAANATQGIETRKLAEIAPVWRYQLERIHKSIDFLICAQNDPIREREIRQHLSEALRQLDVTLPYHITLLDDAENGTSVLLAAFLGEDIFLRQFGNLKSGIRIMVRSCERTEQEKMYVHFQDSKQTPEAFFRKEWLEVWSEPEYLAQNALQTEIASLEFALHIPLLPIGSRIILLPQREQFKVQFEAEINETDALILVVDGTRPNYAPARRLVEQFRPYLLQGRSREHSARMLFLAATYQNRADSTEDLEITTSNLRSLLPLLPAHYEQQHQHGAGKNYFFYPLWIIDAFFATCGMQKRPLAPDLLLESQQYLERLQASYEKIRELFPTLPAVNERQTFREISFEQHEAMLRMSNLPELSHDLLDFLRDVRQRIQLSYARNEIQHALQMLEDIAWEQLDPHLAVTTRSLETLEEAMTTREQKRKTERRHYITRSIAKIKKTWEEGLTHFEQVTLAKEEAPSNFHKSLEQAHSQAISSLIERIREGEFDSYLEHSGTQNLPTWSIDHLGHEVHLRRLLGKMRGALTVALEAELKQAAEVLASTFLNTLQKCEKEDGQLLIYDSPLQTFALSLAEFQKRYQTLKNSISQKAIEACSTITRSEFLHEQHRLNKQTPAIRELLNFVNTDEEPLEAFQSWAHHHLEDLLHTLHHNLLFHTERSILDYFRYELETLDQREVYAPASQFHASSEPGEFTTLLKDLEDQMVEQLRNSEEFRQQLNTLLYPVQDTITVWHNLIKDIRKIKHTPIAARI